MTNRLKAPVIHQAQIQPVAYAARARIWRLFWQKNHEKSRHTAPPAPQAAQSPQAKAFLEYAKAVNADRYRVTAIKMDEDGSRKVFILDKKDGQSMGFYAG